MTNDEMDRASLKAMAADPALFQADLVIPSAHGNRRFGKVMAPFQRERFAAINPALVAVARGRKPKIGKFFWDATKGGSKDSDLAVCLLWLATFTSRPLEIQIGAGKQDQAAEIRKACKDILRLNRWLAEQVSIQNWRIECKATETVAEIITSDSTSSHGSRPDVVILNELSHIADFEFAETMLDNASKVPNGLVCIATNAGFLGTPAYKWREMARTSPRWSFHQLAEPSPWLDPAEIEEARLRNSQARFMRLFYGVWSSGTGDAINMDDVQACVTQSGPLLYPKDVDGWTFTGGLDIGVKHDRSGFVVLGSRQRENRIRLAWCQSWRPPKGGEVDLEKVRTAIIESHQRYNFLKICFDPSQASFMAQQLRRCGIHMEEVRFQGAVLDRMATVLMEVFRTHSIDLYDDPQLIRDLSRLTIEEKQYGQRLTAVADADGHADLGIALSIALPEAQRIANFGGYKREPMQARKVTVDGSRFGVHLKRRQDTGGWIRWG